MIFHGSAAAFLFLLVSSTPVLAQNVVFEEGFGGGMPAGWTNIHLSGSDIWTPGYAQVNGTPDFHHESWCTNGFSFRDNNLVSRPIDLSGLTRATLTFEQFHVYAAYMVFNAVKVSTDGGQTFTVLHQLSAPAEGFSVLQLDMDAYAGLPSVRIGFHYRGTVANDWSIDNVRILTSNPLYSIQNLVAGSTATLFVRGAQPGHTVHFGASLTGAGPSFSPFGMLNLSPPIRRIAVQSADANGDVNVYVRVPPGLTGRTIYSQAVELWAGGGGEPSNSLIQTVQ